MLFNINLLFHNYCSAMPKEGYIVYVTLDVHDYGDPSGAYYFSTDRYVTEYLLLMR